MNPSPERGVTITAGELASEGVGAVLDAVVGTGANAIGLPTGMVLPACDNEGAREPPLDVDGERRVLDRPLWGQRSLNVHKYPVHEADPALWRDLPWQPPEAAPADVRIDYPRQAIDAARQRHLRVYAQLTPYALPGAPAGQESDAGAAPLREEFRPQRLTGGPAPRAIAFTGCLNNPDVRRLGRVRVRELLRHYADVDGLSVDWVEYPVYFLEELFTCFCDHCRATAEALGYDWDAITTGVRGLWDSIHTLTPERVRDLSTSGDWGDLVAEPDAIQTGINQWLNFKAASVAGALADIRATMDANGGAHMTLSANGFALPWGRMSGTAYLPDNIGVVSQRVKLYSFHWLMMVRWWTDTLLMWNRESHITSDAMTRSILALFGIELTVDFDDHLNPATFGMPAPDACHHLTPGSYTDRLDNAITGRDNQAPLMPIIHGYRSAHDLACLLETVRPFASEGLWVQRYGYLGDDKLDLLRQAWI